MGDSEMDSPLETKRVVKLERTGPWVLAALVAVLYVPTWIRHIYRTVDPFTFNDDARILIWPFLRQTDPTLFPNDPFIRYYQAGLPEGYLALYRMLGSLGWARQASEVLQYVSVLVTLALLVVTARILGGRLAAFLAAVLTLGSDAFLDRAGGGLPRGFAFPLIAAGLYALVMSRPRLLAVLAVAGAAFYPVIAALLGASLFVLLVLPTQLRQPPADRSEPKFARGMQRAPDQSDTEQRALERNNAERSGFDPSNAERPHRTSSARERSEYVEQNRHASWSWQRRGIVLLATLFGIVVLLIPTTLRLKGYGDAIGPALLPQFPEAALGGRLSPEQHPPFESFATAAVRHLRVALLGAGDPIGMQWGRWIRQSELRSIAVVVGVIAWSAARVLPRVRQRPELLRLWVLPTVACLLHPVACWVAPRLFLPERYVQFAIPPFVILLASVGLSFDLPCARSRIATLGVRYAVIVVLLVTLAGRGTSWAGIEVYIPKESRALYGAVAKLPKDALIAGWPIGPIENIPYLSERRVLTNYQLEIPFHAQFTLDSRARLRALFEAYFATTSDPLARLCSEFHVTHLLIDHHHYGRSAPDYYEPHRATVARLHASAHGRFLVPQLVAESSSAWDIGHGLSLVELSKLPGLEASCRTTDTNVASNDEAGRRLP